VTLHAEPAPRERRYSDVVQVFEPNALTIPPLDDYVADLIRRREFIAELAGAEMRGLRSSTVIGELWSLVDPIFQASIYMFLFLVIRGGSGATGGSSEYATAIIGSVFFFNYTRISISDGGRAVVRNKGLVLNAIFPRAVLPVAEVYKGLLSTLPALALYAVIFVLMGAPITAAVLLLPFLMLLQTALNLGTALLLSTASVFFKDVGNLTSYLLRVLMFATPVIYPVSMLSPGLKQILSVNPFFALFSAYQAIITGTTPSASLIAQSVFWAALILTAGVRVFLRHERSFGLHV
jgi:teichoic acid transport system permease protein